MIKLCPECVHQIRSIVGANNLTALEFEPVELESRLCEFWAHNELIQTALEMSQR